MAIPRIIHQTWKSSSIPDRFRRYRESWKNLHPDYELRLWTDDDNNKFVREEFPEIWKLYLSLPHGVHRADLLRCLYLWKFGGLYVDLDIQCLRRVDELLNQSGKCAISCEPNIHAKKLHGISRLLSNAAMASIPNHPIWLEMVSEIENRASDKQRSKNPVWASGPICLEHVVSQHNKNDEITIWDSDVFFPLPDIDNISLEISPSKRAYFEQMACYGLYPTTSYGVHHWAHTWIGINKTRNGFYKKLRQIASIKQFLNGNNTIDEVLRPKDYALSFPEKRFIVPRKYKKEHDEKVRLGHRHAKQSRVAIATLIYNRLDLIMKLRARLEHLAKHFDSAEIFIMGDDSTDGTDIAIADWIKSSPNSLHSVPTPCLNDCQNIFQRMARLRNGLLREIEFSSKDFDYVIFIDGDLQGSVSDIGLYHTMGILKDGPDAVSAFGINNWGILPYQFPYIGYSYYDALAFRENSFKRAKKDAAIRWGLRHKKRGSKEFLVKSAFGGMCIYKHKAINSLRYPEDSSDCEHVLFHQLLAKRGHSIAVNPSFLLLAGKQGHHTQKINN